MIDTKYIELINRDIDKTISKKQKEKLEEYLDINPDARKLYKELFRTEELLDKLPENNPSINLKKRILNSINYNLYSSKKKKSIYSDYIAAIFLGSRTKIATTIALGLIVAGFIFSTLFYNSYFETLIENENVYGTIGLTESQIIESFNVDSESIYGGIEISKGINSYIFNIDINSNDSYNMKIEYDPTKISYEDVSFNNLNNIKVEKGTDFINLTCSEKHPYSLVLSLKNISFANIALKIIKNNKQIFEKDIRLTND